MKKLFVSALAIIGLVACAKDDVVSVQDNRSAIGFNTFVENATRVDPSITNDSIQEFSVWAYMNSEDGVVFNDELVTLSNGAWTYTNLQYWLVGNDYTFAAFAGDRADVTGLPEGVAMSNEGLGEITFTNVEGTNDILFAAATVNNAKADQEAVNIQFDHLLSKVKFSFRNGFANPNTTITVEDIKMTAPSTGRVNLAVAAYNTPYVWTRGTEAVTLEFGDMNGLNKLSISEGAKESDDQRLTIPTGADYEYNVTFLVKVYNGAEKGLERPMEVKLSGIEFVAGHAYNLVATINQENLNLNAIEFTVEVDEWVEEEVDADAKVDYSYDSAANIAQVENANGLQEIAAAINEGTVASDATIVLNGDIDLSAMTRSVESNWTPIGTEENPYTGTFNGNGNTIKNLTLVETEAKEGKAFIGFFGYAKNATIQNVTFENVYINIPCLDIDHSQGHIGAVAGSLEGTSTIENVTVKGDIEVYATQNANGASRVAVVAGGNSYGNVTMKNVHVIANEGSYLIANNNTGALAGQLQGKSVFENCSSNIDVTVNKFFAGGIIGLAAGDQTFINCHTTGDVAVVAGREGRAHDQYRVGGIAGGWGDGAKNVCTLVDCSYTGNISGKNSDGSVANPLDYFGYVGRGYTLNGCQGSKVVVNGTEFVQKYNTADKAGIYTINGCTPVSTADELVAALAEGEGVYLLNDITVAATKGGYDKAGILQNKAQTIDGGGHTLTVTGAGATWSCAIYTNGGIIRNLTVAGAMRGIFTAGQSSDLHIENVEFKNVIYTFNSDGKMPANPFGVYVSNSTVNGWTSHSDMHTEVVYTNCSFGEGSGYAYCRPYGKTAFVNCTFSAGYSIDKTRTTELTFTDCTWEE